MTVFFSFASYIFAPMTPFGVATTRKQDAHRNCSEYSADKSMQNAIDSAAAVLGAASPAALAASPPRRSRVHQHFLALRQQRCVSQCAFPSEWFTFHTIECGQVYITIQSVYIPYRCHAFTCNAAYCISQMYSRMPLLFQLDTETDASAAVATTVV